MLTQLHFTANTDKNRRYSIVDYLVQQPDFDVRLIGEETNDGQSRDTEVKHLQAEERKKILGKSLSSSQHKSQHSDATHLFTTCFSVALDNQFFCKIHQIFCL